MTLAGLGSCSRPVEDRVGSTIKLIPGAGTIIGGAINTSVAGGVTFAMGKAWALFCHRLAKGEFVGVDGVLDNDAIRRVFADELRR